MTKIVVNKCFGGFGLSHDAIIRYGELKNLNIVFEKTGYYTQYFKDNKLGDNDAFFSEYDLDRDDSALIQVVEELGDRANGDCAKLEVVEIPDDVDWYIHEYDGNESVNETHRSW